MPVIICQPYQAPVVAATTSFDPSFYATSSLIHADSTFLDAATGYTWATGGTPVISATQSKFGGAAMKFTAADPDVITDATIPIPNTTPFTLEFWIFLNTVGVLQTFYSQYTSANAQRTLFSIDASNKINAGHGTNASVIGATSLSVSTWYHIAITKDASNTLRLFLNGTLDASGTWASGIQQTPGWIGQLNNSSSKQPLDAYVDEFRITSGVCRYVNNFTAPASAFLGGADDYYTANTSLLLHFNGTNGSTTYTDQVGNVFTGTGTVSLSNTQFLFGNTSLNCGAGAGYISAPAASTFNVGAGNFTLEAWVYQTAATGNQGIAGQYLIGSGVNSDLGLYLNAGKPTGSFTSGGTTTTVASASAISLNTWTHIAFVRQGVNNINLFVNGVSVANAASAQTFDTSSRVFAIGADSSGANIFNGFIDEVRLTNGLARYITTFVPQSSEFPNVQSSDPFLANTICLLHMDGTSGSTTFTDATGNTTFTANGDANIVTTSPYIGSGKGSFGSGAGGYIVSPAASVYTAFSGSDFTIEGWITSSSAATQTLAFLSTTAGTTWANGFLCDVGLISNKLYFEYSNGTSTSQVIQSTLTVPTTGLNHVAIVKTGTTILFWINGAYAGTGTVSGLNSGAIINNFTTQALGFASDDTIAFGAGVFVTVNDSGAGRWSSDGVTWNTMTTPPASKTWDTIIYGASGFVALPADTTGIGSFSADGKIWSSITIGVTANSPECAYGNGMYLAVGMGTNQIATSTNGTSWTTQTANLTITTKGYSNSCSLAFGAGLWVLTGTSNGHWYTSPDGINWTDRGAKFARAVNTIFANGLFVTTEGGSPSANIIWTSPDGLTWTSRTMPSTATWTGIAYGASGFVVVADSGGAFAAQSTDGITWNSVSTPGGSMRMLAYGNGVYFATQFSSSGLITSAKINRLTVGRTDPNFGTTNFFIGSIDELRITTSARYQTGFFPMTTPPILA